MYTKFYCNSENCTDGDKGPFVLDLPQEAIMDKHNLATVFCPQCRRPMKPMPADTHNAQNTRFYCHSESCGSSEEGLFYLDLPDEAVMDKHNLADIFCPKCGRTMKPFGAEQRPAVNC